MLSVYGFIKLIGYKVIWYFDFYIGEREFFFVIGFFWFLGRREVLEGLDVYGYVWG